MNYYGLSGKMTATAGNQAKLIGILLKAADLLQSNEGCIQYVISQMDDDRSVWVNEVWTSKQAHDDSLKTVEIRNLVMSAIPLLSSMPVKGAEFVTVGGKGI